MVIKKASKNDIMTNFYGFVFDLASSIDRVKSQYQLDSDNPIEILDDLSMISKNLEDFNQEILKDLRFSLDILLEKLKKHYKGFNDSEEIAKVLDIYKKYFP